MGERIRQGKDAFFPGRGGCGKLAERLGVTPQLLSHWMRGNRIPEPEQLAALAKLFETSILELCSFPKIRRTSKPPSALDVIIDVTNNRKNAVKTGKARRKFNKETASLKSLIKNELEDFMP